MTNKEMQQVVQELLKRVERLEHTPAGFDKAIYSIQEVADMMGVTREAVYQRISRGEIPTIKLGTTKVRAVDIANLIGYAH